MQLCIVHTQYSCDPNKHSLQSDTCADGCGLDIFSSTSIVTLTHVLVTIGLHSDPVDDQVLKQSADSDIIER